jgi:hypothetical protein
MYVLPSRSHSIRNGTIFASRRYQIILELFPRSTNPTEELKKRSKLDLVQKKLFEVDYRRFFWRIGSQSRIPSDSIGFRSYGSDATRFQIRLDPIVGMNDLGYEGFFRICSSNRLGAKSIYLIPPLLERTSVFHRYKSNFNDLIALLSRFIISSSLRKKK